jgi:hypothetical protein
MPAGEIAWTVAWRHAGPRLAGEWVMRDPFDRIERARLRILSDASRLEVMAPGARVERDGNGLVVEAVDLHPATPEGVRQPVVSWRVARHGELSVLAGRADALEVVARRAVRASVPEPAARIATDRRAIGQPSYEVQVVAGLLSYVRAQVHRGRLPGQRAIEPRRLLEARRSRWATPWESALLLARYLRQLRVAARPMPVRAPRSGAGDPWSPVAFDDGAVVRVAMADAVVWLDPSCAVCAPGEIDPSLWGGRVLDEELTALPDSPGGTVTWRLELEGEGSVRFTGTEATRLRQDLARVAIDARPAFLLARLGAAELGDVLGLDPGSEIAIEIRGVDPARSTALAFAEVFPAGEPSVVTPWVGTHRLTARLGTAPASQPVVVEAAGARYERRVVESAGEWVGLESLTFTGPVVPRTTMLAIQSAR